ncbi:MAG: hypothetical protein IPJ99_09715 [Betaproteobacteria bacterium]|jgi:uncharacterized low-complexity protein|nr:hypothetical protein [Betaproteobacteria bacterium]MBK8916546.1 hypothetical protein [Betaproteobacteria bacterium]
MSSKKTTLSLAVGTAFAATALLAPIAHAADNPFSLTKLDSGYQLAAADDKAKDGKCGEAKCGADKKKDAKCGADKKKDGSCGGDKKKDGKCGEAKCGADKKK